jgi:hypothetical protein
VSIMVYSIAGGFVASLCDREWDPGRHSVQWRAQTRDGSVAASGVYMCRMEAGGFESTVKITLLE